MNSPRKSGAAWRVLGLVIAAVVWACAPSIAGAQTTAACCQTGGSCVVRTECDCESRGGVWQTPGSACLGGSCVGVQFGACCIGFSTGFVGCVVTTSATCAAMAPAQYAGNNTACNSGFAPCFGPIREQACCCGTGCLLNDPALCAYAGGTSFAMACNVPLHACCDPVAGCVLIASPCGCAGTQFFGQTCSPDPCPAPATGSCCNGASCTNTTQAACGGNWGGAGTACISQPCGTCCSAGACSFRTQSQCTTAGGTWSSGGSCTATPCGACCVGTTCTYVTPPLCNGAHSPGVACSPNPCQPLGECCTSLGTCLPVTQANCTVGSWTQGGTCNPNPCQVMGRCCDSAGGCTVTTLPNCGAGQWQSGGSCVTIGQCLGACCRGSCCAATGFGTCTGGTFQGIGTTCGANPCPPPSNDTCASSAPLILGVTFNGSNCQASTDNPPSCATGSLAHVWHEIQITHLGLYEINTCGSTMDTVVALYAATANCATVSLVACNDDNPGAPCGSGAVHGRIPSVLLSPGFHYVQVGSSGTTRSTGQYSVVVFPLHPYGECCDPTGVCTLTDVVNCPAGARFVPGAGTCSPNPCAGACCDYCTRSCIMTLPAGCPADRGVFHANGTCVPDPCRAPCCVLGAPCSVTQKPACAAMGGNWFPMGGQCGGGVGRIFAFLTLWFGSSLAADCNGDCQATVQDIFCFLTQWFGGC